MCLVKQSLTEFWEGCQAQQNWVPRFVLQNRVCENVNSVSISYTYLKNILKKYYAIKAPFYQLTLFIVKNETLYIKRIIHDGHILSIYWRRKKGSEGEVLQ